MKKILSLLLLVLFLSGCVTYKFDYGQKPYGDGYIVSRDGSVILEYTRGKDNSVPADLGLAKERFNRRRKAVEYYYRQMGYLTDRFKITLWDYPMAFIKGIFGIFRLPAVIISEHKYEHDPEYREKMKKIEEEACAQEQARVNQLKERLSNYIEEDLTVE
ncbi:MAG: lipoprotein [Candidatus Omnitrophica bacterium]|nr:lipoprotein [Candidatus Omnitrophota bacterium]